MIPSGECVATCLKRVASKKAGGPRKRANVGVSGLFISNKTIDPSVSDLDLEHVSCPLGSFSDVHPPR